MWTWSGVVLPIFTMASVMAAVISRFCWSVRPAYHWIVMFGMARLLGVDRVGCGRDYRSAPSVGQSAGPRPAWPGTTATIPGLTPAEEPHTWRGGGPRGAERAAPRGGRAGDRLWKKSRSIRSSNSRSHAAVGGYR